MFDNLRDSTSDFYEEEPNSTYQETAVAKPVARPRRRKSTRFLGMTAQQRFFLSLMLMFMVCAMGVLAMVVLQKMALPF